MLGHMDPPEKPVGTTAYLSSVLEDDGGKLAINPLFDKLITSLRTAVDVDGTLQNEPTSYNDIFDWP